MAESTPAMTRRDSTDSEPQSNSDTDVKVTFCFVDIAGYTALTDIHGEHVAADLANGFTCMLRKAVASPGKVD